MPHPAGQPSPSGGIALLRRSPLIAHCARRLVHRCGVHTGARLVVGLSGGADSVALAVILSTLARRRSPLIAPPILVHVHHHLRGESADTDAAHAQHIAGLLGAPFLLRDIAPEAQAGNLAAAARRLRLAALRDVALELRASHVATAHHADDQLETIIMRLARGCGPDGLRGLRWQRPMGQGITLIRPLLGVRHADLCALLRRGGISWREDQSNLSASTLRGKMRRNVTPDIERLWPDAALRASDAATAADTARRLLQRALLRHFGPRERHAWAREDIRSLEPGMCSAGLRRAAIAMHPRAGRRLTFAHLDRAAECIRSDDSRPRTLVWPGGLRLDITAKAITLTTSC